jgi:putative ABC transport system permease protein
MLENVRQDIRYALRGLRANPGFTAGVVLTIALGIGANAAMFGIVDRMLFRPPPMMVDPSTVHRPYGSTIFRGKESTRNMGNQYAMYRDIANWTSSFSAVAGFTERKLAVGIGDAAREMQVACVSANFFGFFDAPPVLGRYFTTAEDTPPNGANVVVLSYPTWEMQYGSRRDAIGSRVQIGPAIYTVIGVAPRGFVGLWASAPPSYFIPITSYGAVQAAGFGWLGKKNWWQTYQWGWMQVMVRRKPGVSIERANADLTAAYNRSYDAQSVENDGRSTPRSIAKPKAFVGSILTERGPNESKVAKVATWVGGVALIVLLIAMANVANLLLARALRRRREIALRLALGISRARLLSQLLTESLVLALLGGAAGVLIAQWGGAALRAAFSTGTAPVPAIRDGRTLLFTAGAAIAVGMLTGVAPVIQAGRASLTNDLRTGSREGTYHRSRVRIALLLFQGALSVLLLVGAGLFVRSLRNVDSIRLGYDVDPVLTIGLNMRGAKPDSSARIALREQLMRAAKSVPGVEYVSLSNSLPFWSHWSTTLYVTGIDTVDRLGQFELNAVSPDYFSLMGTRILRGHAFTDADGPTSQKVMIVSDAMARKLWPGKDAIGQCVRVSADTMPCTYVVGIAENIKNQNLSDDPGLFYYMPATQFAPGQGDLLVRTRGRATEYMEAVRRALQREMPGAAYVIINPFSDAVTSQAQSWKLGATMFTAFGILALVLASIGLYSVIAYNVAQRTHEMGVRVALGAQVGDVIRMVVREGATLGIVGVAIGTGAALLAARWVKPLLFDVSATDPLVFTSVIVLLIAVAIAASWVPARRASRVDPQVALRSE